MLDKNYEKRGSELGRKIHEALKGETFSAVEFMIAAGMMFANLTREWPDYPADELAAGFPELHQLLREHLKGLEADGDLLAMKPEGHA